MTRRSHYGLQVPGHVADMVRGLHPQIERKLRAALTEVMADPLLGNALRDELCGLRSFRVGRFRIIYRTSDRGEARPSIELIAFGPRARIYEETYRLVARRP